MVKILGDLSHDKKIFRYTSYSSLLQMMNSSENLLSKVSSWKKHDPFEDVICSIAKVNLAKNETIHFHKLTEHFYGQCWTTEIESEIMWQVYRARYSNKGGAVKIQTTIGNLKDTLDKHHSAYIGPVSYLRKAGLITLAKDFREKHEPYLLGDGGSGRNVAKLLLVKRYPYRFEKEVRLLFGDYESKGRQEFADYFSYRVDLEKMIQKVVFDPHMDIKSFHLKKRNIQKTQNNLKIVRSNLYKLVTNDFE